MPKVRRPYTVISEAARLAERIPPDKRHFFDPLTQHRHELADWLDARITNNRITNLRRATVSYLREIELLPQDGRWSKHRQPMITYHFGLHCTEFLARGGTVPTNVAVDRIRSFRESSDPKSLYDLGKPQPDAAPLEKILPTPPPTDEQWRALEGRALLAEQSERRIQFVAFLKHRKGWVNPKNIYVKWRGLQRLRPGSHLQVGPGRRRYKRIEEDMREQLGRSATELLLNTPPTDRHELANKLSRV